MKNNFGFKQWHSVALRGVLALVFGGVAFTLPLEAIYYLTLYFGIMTLLSGGTLLIFTLFNRKTSINVPLQIFQSIFDILFGLILLANIAESAVWFIVFLGAWVVITSAVHLWFVLMNRAKIKTTAYAIINECLAILLGIGLIFYPQTGLIASSWVMGFASLFFGAALLISANQMRDNSWG